MPKDIPQLQVEIEAKVEYETRKKVAEILKPLRDFVNNNPDYPGIKREGEEIVVTESFMSQLTEALVTQVKSIRVASKIEALLDALNEETVDYPRNVLGKV